MSDNVSLVAGPLLIGYCLVCGLFVVLSYQICIYHQSFRKSDKTFIKCLVYGLYVLVVAQTILNIYDAIWTFALDYGSVASLTNRRFTYITVPFLTGAIALLVQVFYARRIYILTGSSRYLLPAIITGLSIFQFFAGIATGVIVALQHDLLQVSQLKFIKIVQAVWVIPSGVCDVVIAVCMWNQVYNSRKDNIMRRTQAVLLQVVKLVIGTGLMTATVCVLSGIFFVGFPHGIIYGIFALSLGPLYANSMLVVLNNRLRHTDLIGNHLENATSRAPDRSSVHFRSWNSPEAETFRSIPPIFEEDNNADTESFRMSDVSSPRKVVA